MTIADRSAANAAPTAANLIERAVELAPRLAEQAQAIDEARRLPATIAEQFVEEGLVDVVRPWRFGGEGEYDLSLAVTYELARGSGSAAWCHAVWAQHTWMLGLWPDEMQEEFFVGTPGALCSSGFNPAGAQVESVDGGYDLSGRWSFSSGCDNAEWLMLAALLPERQLAYLMVPREHVTIDDTWFASGLRGTGSKDVVVANAFVPAHRVATAAHLTEPRETRDRPSYSLSVWSLVSLSLTYVAMGMGRGALDAFASRLLEGGVSIAGNRPRDVAATQLRLSEAAVELDAASLLCDRSVEEMLSRAAAGHPPDLEDRLRHARDRAYACRLVVQAVNRLFEVSGATGLYEKSAIQRFHRDVHAASHQPIHAWDTYGLHYGRTRVGLELGPAARLI